MTFKELFTNILCKQDARYCDVLAQWQYR